MTTKCAVVLFLLAAGCSSSKGASTMGEPAGAVDSGASCVRLTDVSTGECPRTWHDAQAAKAMFCADNSRTPVFDAFLSSAPCGGYLHYTRYLFDGGPRYCLYDPSTQALAAYAAVDGKALYEAMTCGSARADFDEKNCVGTTCKADQATCNDLQRRATEAVVNAASSVEQCSTAADCQIVNGFAFACIDCLHIVGNDAVKAAIAAKADSIAAICTEFTQAGCKVSPSGCPGLPLESITCLKGVCKLP